tara:strand:+ start:24165 stop:24704 length:540 start_codon:yes stop_codon:yes gene_type:complete
MKTLKLFLFCTLLISASCKNDDDTPTNPIDQLPPATQTGANTAGALVNGEAFLPNNGSLIPLVLNYIDGEDFTLGITNKVNNLRKAIVISIYNTPLQVNQTYQLNTEFGANSKTGEYFINTAPPPLPNYYSTTPVIIGELTITNHDFNNAILSGTFWFDAINSVGEIVEIREGRFDMEY